MSEIQEVALYSLGDCPLCGDTGDVTALRSKLNGSLVFFCTLCCLAWRNPPGPNPEDYDGECLMLSEVAPLGVEFPLLTEIQACGFDIDKLVPLGDWQNAMDRSRFGTA
jgi:hypothetical protein